MKTLRIPLRINRQSVDLSSAILTLYVPGNAVATFTMTGVGSEARYLIHAGDFRAGTYQAWVRYQSVDQVLRTNPFAVYVLNG